jgi:iron complex outermembrane recepter protein
MRALKAKQKLITKTIAATLALMAHSGAVHAGKELEEVIVTAQKKDETLQTVPMTVNAVTADTISKYNLLDFKDIQSVTPGLTIQAQDTRTSTIAMRGVNVLTDTGYGPGVAIYWNEVNYDIDSAFSAMYDIGQVEVLRGPQGTLRGITAPAGAVTFVTKGPSFNEIEGTIEQTLGERSLSNTQFGISLPIIEDVLALRIAGLYD